MEEKEMQEKLVRYQILQNRVEVFSKRRDLLINRMVEVENTLSSLEEIDRMKQEDIFLPLGSGVYASGNLKDEKKMMVLIGANVAVDMTAEEVKKFLEGNRKILENGLQSIDEELARMSEELIELEPEIREIVEKSR